MSSFDIEQVRRYYQDPMMSKVALFSKKIAALESDNVEIESDDVVGLGDSDHTKVKYTDFWNFIKKHRSRYAVIRFDGSNDWVDCTNDSQLWSQSLTKFSFAFWCYPTTLDGTLRDLVNHGQGTAQGFSCYINSSPTGRVTFQIRNAVGTQITAFFDTLTLNAWNHVACVYDNSLGSNNLKIYVNGVVGTNASLTEAINLSTALTISNSTTDFAGDFYDFRWYTKKALTGAEVILVRDDSPLAPVPNYWQTFQDGPAVAKDVISGYKLATFTNGTFYPSLPDIKCPDEPDYNNFVQDVRFNHFGGYLTDYSGFNHTVNVFGDPCPTTGSDVQYLGGTKKNVAHQVLQDADNHISYQIPDDYSTLRILGKTVGMSYVFRLNFKSFNNGGVIQQRLWSKRDDVDNCVTLKVTPGGQLRFLIERANVEYKVLTNSSLSLNTDYLIVYTYAVSGNVQHVYVNAVDQTLSADTDTLDSNPTSTSYLLSGEGGTSGAGCVDLNYIDMFRVYQEQVLTQTHVNNLHANKLTISTIPAGEVAWFDCNVLRS